MRKTLIIVIATLFLFSCENKHNFKTDDFYKINFKDLSPKDHIKFSDIIDSTYELIPLETGDNVIGRVSKIYVTKARLYILDAMSSKSLFIFNRSGEFISTIGSIGKGPNEFQLPVDFYVDEEKDEIQILDNGNRIIFYDIYGNYIRDIKLNQFGALNYIKLQNGYAFIGGGQNDNLLLVDDDMSLKNSYFHFINPQYNRAISNPLQIVNDSLAIYRKFMNDTVYCIQNWTIKPHIIFNLGNSSYPKIAMVNPEKIIEKQVILKMYYETSKDCYSVIFKDSEPFICIHCKASRNSLIIPYNKFENDVTFEKKSSYVIGTDDDNDAYVFLVEPYNLLKNLSQDPPSLFDPKNKRILELSHKITNTSNPILLIAKLKHL